jgi:hypothetical protein
MGARRTVLMAALVLVVSSAPAWADRHRADAALALVYAHESTLWADNVRCCYSISLPVHPDIHLSVIYFGGDVEGDRGSGAERTKVGINLRGGVGLRYTFKNKLFGLALPCYLFPVLQVGTVRVRVREENLTTGEFVTKRRRDALLAGGLEYEFSKWFSFRVQGNVLFADFPRGSKRVWGLTGGLVVGHELAFGKKKKKTTPRCP